MKTILTSLKDLKLAMKGESLLSSQLEKASLQMIDGRIPDLWAKNSYPSLKPLGSYVVDLKNRI